MCIHTITHLHRSSGENESSTDPEAFRFYPPESEPYIPPDVRNRAYETLEDLISETDTQESDRSCCSNTLHCCLVQPRRFPGDGLIPPFTPLLQRVSSQGLRAMVFFLNPSLPRVFRDAWVLIELAVTLYQFFLACVSLAENHNQAFNIIYISIASVALLLSLIDVTIHCVQLGSFASLLLYCRSKLKSKKQHAGYSDPESVQSCCLLGKKGRKRINNSLEMVRNVLSELILYPLLICDMFDFVVSGSFNRTDSGEKINFSLFIVGGFYLVLSVYLARMLMIAFSLYTLRRLPQSASHTQKTYVNMMIKFGIHVMGQMLLSIVIIASIGIKIRHENSTPCSNGRCVRASPYLIYAIIAGGFLPIIGIFSFFFINIYKIRVMSVSLWVDMVSLLQSESITSVVFAKEGIHKAKDTAANFTREVQLVEVRKQLKGVIGSTPSWAKRLYPLRFPAFWVYGVLFTLLLLSFIAALFLSQPEEDFASAFFDENLGLVAIIAGVLLVISNIHLLFLVSVLTVIVATLLLLVILSPAFIVAAIILYLPLGCLCGCIVYLKGLAGEMSVFSKPSAHKARIQSAIRTTRHELRK